MRKKISDISNILTSSEKRRFVLLIFLNALLSIADIGSIALVFVVLNIYSGEPVAWVSPVLQKLNIQQQSIIPVVLLMIIFIAKTIAGYFISKAQFRHISDVASRLTGKSLLLYLEGSYEDHVNIDSAVWMRRICFQTLEFAQFVLSGIQQVINEAILIVISIVALALYNAKLLVIVSLVLLPAVLIISYITKKRLKETRQNIKSSNELSLQYLNEAITGFVESNIYDGNEFFIKRYTQSRFKLNRFVADMQVTQMIPNRFFEVFAVLGLFILILAVKFEGGEGGEGGANILMLGAFVAAAYKIIPGISKIIGIAGQIRTYLFTATELAEQGNVHTSTVSPSSGNYIESIELRDIQFSYGENIVFKNLNCLINKNTFVGISGNSGKGKTTLIDIILGFLTPLSGTVLFNGQIIAAGEIKNLWPQIAYVKQAAFLVHDSILNNITLYRDADKKKLDGILEVTGLNEWISQLPEGIHTVITESGKNISGGQRQRITIARALFKDPPVIILDEPFNELDEDSELSLLKYLKELSSKGKTILLVTHNTNSFSFCDNVIYLNEKAQ
ncbi:MAG TPA: ABC transporter ATP-binding protein [Parafilimonas sp.]|nr:ABC transporter ATP-binding protein [Parafilimonas sp.]